MGGGAAEKAPRAEHTRLRTPIGEGYNQLVSDLREIQQLLTCVAASAAAAAGTAGNAHQSKQATEPTDQFGKALEVISQRAASLTSGTYFTSSPTSCLFPSLPSVVQKTINLAERRLSGQDGYEKDSADPSDISKLQQMIANAKTFSIELAGRLDQEHDFTGMGAKSPKFKMSLTSRRAVNSDSLTRDPPQNNITSRLSFMSSASDNVMDFSKRIYQHGNILDRLTPAAMSQGPATKRDEPNENRLAADYNADNNAPSMSFASTSLFQGMAKPFHDDGRPFIGPRLSKALRGKRTERENTSGNDAGTKRRKVDSDDGTKSAKTQHPLESRSLPTMAPRTKVAQLVNDWNENRVVNPLLRLPQYPDGAPSHEVPQGGELWKIADLMCHAPDTYPVSYLARLLGFDVPESSVRQQFGSSLDASTLPLKVRGGLKSPNTSHSYYDQVICRDIQQEIFCESTHGGHDQLLSHVDPLYSSILSTNIGQDDVFKDATGKAYVDELSQLCLDLAKERNLLGNLSFRYATESDWPVLHSISNGISTNGDGLASSPKSPSTFCILADGKDHDGTSVPVAFIQYRFRWFRVEDKKVGQQSTDRISELILFVDNLTMARAAGGQQPTFNGAQSGKNVSSGNGHLNKREEVAKTLLTSLALIHAARAGIWYGIIDATLSLVPFFTKYFRASHRVMGEVVPLALRDRIPLALDLKKCHYRYAILLLEECLNDECDASTSNTAPTKIEKAKQERLLVYMDTDSSVSTPRNVSSRSCVRLLRSRETEKSRYVVHATPTEYDEQNAVDVIEEEIAAPVTNDWNIARTFPNNVDSTCATYDSVAAEIECKRVELSRLESSVEHKARELLSSALDEHSSFTDKCAEITRDEEAISQYEAMQTRVKEAELAWQAQLDQDMDAVCDVCNDGEVTLNNQIIFCDACNVAVHQKCYGIDHIPSGNFFCRTCIHFDVDKEYLAARKRGGPPVKLTRHPIICELCPRRQGAFVQVDSLEPTKKAKWVHVGCAKWQGMNYVSAEQKDKIEDLTELKAWFKAEGHVCYLCKSGIGALHQCREKGCGKWMHLTCARSFGKCSVQHGENCVGFFDPQQIDHPPWTLACPDHSSIDPENLKKNRLTEEQLVTLAETYPPEPEPPKPFTKMNGTERKIYWADCGNLTEFLSKVTLSLEGDRCVLCQELADPNTDVRCPKCGVLSHADCVDPARGKSALCLSCRYKEENEGKADYEEPTCHMCSHSAESGGSLLRSYARPVSMRTWKENRGRFQRSIFGKNKFMHALCGMWNESCRKSVNEDGDLEVNASDLIMADGKRHVTHQYRCTICGLFTGAKVDCCDDECVAPDRRSSRAKMHVTCARQAGLEVSVEGDEFSLACFKHVKCQYVFRARLEDMKEIELQRNSSSTFKPGSPMTWGHASALFHAAVNILKTLGWAWRWAEWWVEAGDNWEPLLEEGQREEEMTEEELKIVKSTPESRCRDARQCRLAALGAALRNRDYDKEEGVEQESLERALTAVLSTRSLVGPLKKKEIEFFSTWLVLAYRSKLPILGFGKDKAPVADDGFCVHQADESPKYVLGVRPLPGKKMPQKGVFEPQVAEPDDFLLKPASSSPRGKRKKQTAA